MENKEIQFIGIRLHDIDFSITFMELLESIHKGITSNWDFHYPLSNKTVIEEAIYEGIKFHYLIFQLRDNYGKKGYRTIDQTIRYLQKNIKILFNEEAVNYFMENPNIGGCWILNVQTGEISGY